MHRANVLFGELPMSATDSSLLPLGGEERALAALRLSAGGLSQSAVFIFVGLVAAYARFTLSGCTARVFLGIRRDSSFNGNLPEIWTRFSPSRGGGSSHWVVVCIVDNFTVLTVSPSLGCFPTAADGKSSTQGRRCPQHCRPHLCASPYTLRSHRW